jgi:hypothetical protein
MCELESSAIVVILLRGSALSYTFFQALRFAVKASWNFSTPRRSLPGCGGRSAQFSCPSRKSSPHARSGSQAAGFGGGSSRLTPPVSRKRYACGCTVPRAIRTFMQRLKEYRMWWRLNSDRQMFSNMDSMKKEIRDSTRSC